MDVVALLRGLKGSFHFLHPSEAELRRLLGSSGAVIPAPQPVFLEGERPTSLYAYLVRESATSAALEEALRRSIYRLETDVLTRTNLDDIARGSADWHEYERLLANACENVTASDYGRHYPAVFWLDHSTHIAGLIRTVRQRLSTQSPPPGEAQLRAMRFAILDCLMHRIDLVLQTVRDRVAPSIDGEGELYPKLFRCMRDNVLIFSESSIGGALFGLEDFLRTLYDTDGKDFRRRWQALVKWHRERLGSERRLEELSRFLTGVLDDVAADRLLTVPGYVSFLSSAKAWDEERLWTPTQVKIWEDLLPRLKVFELLHGLRRLTLRVGRHGDRLVCPASEAQRMGAGDDNLDLSPTLRPLDFTTPWVVDPGVARSGLVYDIIHFTRIVSSMREAGDVSEEAAFRGFFKLQRRLDRIAEEHRLYREKYLGDGVFYTGRDSRRLLVAAIRMQRAYRETVRLGFAFDRGMRLALNHGSYRLLPFGGPGDRGGERYEIFGEAVVELFRLISGKSNLDLQELHSLLVSRGYEEDEVRRFFAPLTADGDAAAALPALPFSAHLTPSGQLMNNGIVATEAVLEDLQTTHEIHHFRLLSLGTRQFILIALQDAGQLVQVGVRRLGRPDLKGLSSPMLLEVVDRELFSGGSVTRVEAVDLAAALDELDPAAVARDTRPRC